MAKIFGKIEVNLTIKKFEPENKGEDPLNRSGECVKLIVSEINTYNFLTIKEALKLLNKFK